MLHRRSLLLVLGSATGVLAGTLLAQNAAPATPAGAPDLATLPLARGIYYHSLAGWIALQSNLLLPLGGGWGAQQFLGFDDNHAVEQIPGPHAGVQLGNDVRPVLYLRGITTQELYLVRAHLRDDYRELRMPVDHHFAIWAHYRAKDVAPLDLQALPDGIVAVRPRGELKPGEYTLATTLQQGDPWVRLGYDFGVAGTAAH